MSLANPTTAQAAAAEFDDYLTVPEAAAILRTTPQTIYAAINAGEIEDVFRGGRRLIRIPLMSFRAYLASKTA